MPKPILQSILLNKNRFSLKQAVQYLYLHGIREIKKVDETDDWYRFRQVNPEMLKERGYTKFRNKVIIPNEVEFIFAFHPNF